MVTNHSRKLEYSRLINTLATLGAVLVGLGILLFIASNWDKLGRSTKISIIFSIIALFNFAGYYFRIKKEQPGLSEGFLLIGAFSFGAGIWLIAQIYQIHYNFSAGVLFWILGILPVALFYRSWPVLSLSSILGAIWLFSYMGYYPERQAYGFFLLLSAITALSYIQKQRFSLFVMIFTLAVWLGRFCFLKLRPWEYYFENSFLGPQLALAGTYMCFGFILYGLGIWHLRGKRFSGFAFLYKFLGVLFVVFSAYSLTYAHHYDKEKVAVWPVSLMGLIVILSFLVAAIFFWLSGRSKEKTESREIRLTLDFFVLGLLAVFISFSRLKAVSLSFNFVTVIVTLGFMYLGFLRHSEGIFRLSIALFFLNILSRYFDIFWKMMPRSLLFIFGGVLLIIGSIFVERKRKQIEEKMHGG